MEQNCFAESGMYRRNGRSIRRTKDAQRQIGELLFELGVTPHTEGYALLRDGVRVLADAERYRHIRLTDELYSLIGELYRQEKPRVEHAVRDAIRLAWQRENAEPQTALQNGEAPSNAALLYLLAYRMKTARSQWE